MNIDDIVGLSTSVKDEIKANKDVENFICSSAYFVDLVAALNTFLKPLLEAETERSLEQSYVQFYTDEPHGCNNEIPMLLFAPLRKDDRAFPYSWIAKLPLLPNYNCVPIYFPTEIIINNNLVRNEIARSGKHKFSIPLVLSDFIYKPANFLSIYEIEKRVKGKL